MDKKLRILSLNFGLGCSTVGDDFLETENALFDFDVVVIHPPDLAGRRASPEIYRKISSAMYKKEQELRPFFAQGGVLVVFLAAPSIYRVKVSDYPEGYNTVNNYEFLDRKFVNNLRRGKGSQITYDNSAEPFIGVLRKSDVAWTSYVTGVPDNLKTMKFFAFAGKAGALAGKMQYGEGHVILLPNVTRMDEASFVQACVEYRFQRQGTPPPDWVNKAFVPGVPPIESSIAALNTQIAELQTARQLRERELEERSAYRKLLYEKGKTQLEPIVLRALDDLEFGTSPSEIIKGTNHEIDGRTSKGTTPGIVEVKGSKNQIVQSEFSSFVTKILADSEVNNAFSKGILVGNGLCETEPGERLGDAVFSPHVLDGARRHSVALVNSVELYWLCCALLRGDPVDKSAVREVILNGNGYVDLKPFCGESLFTAKAPITQGAI